MSWKTFNRLCSLLLTLITLGCTSVTVVPESKNLVWQNGRAFQIASDSSTEIRAALDYKSSDHMRFIVDVHNIGQIPILVRPSSFALAGEAMSHVSVSASDPEMRIAGINQEIEWNEGQVETHPTDALQALADTLSVIAGETQQQRTDRQNRLAERQTEREEAQRRLIYLRDKKLDFENHYLRANTLAPGATVSGFVEFDSPQLHGGELSVLYLDQGRELRIGFTASER